MARTVGSKNSEKFTRKQPTAAEQARRKAWGKEYGPKVGQSIRDAIKKEG